MEANAGILLVHEPPPASVSVVADPIQTSVVPEIAVGSGLTVTLVVMRQDGDNSYVIIVVPEETPVTTPVPEPTVAIPGLELDHAPNAVASEKVVLELIHVAGTPVIGAGVEVIFST
jgi:hypothetical protein